MFLEGDHLKRERISQSWGSAGQSVCHTLLCRFVLPWWETPEVCVGDVVSPLAKSSFRCLSAAKLHSFKAKVQNTFRFWFFYELRHVCKPRWLISSSKGHEMAWNQSSQRSEAGGYRNHMAMSWTETPCWDGTKVLSWTQVFERTLPPSDIVIRCTDCIWSDTKILAFQISAVKFNGAIKGNGYWWP